MVLRRVRRRGGRSLIGNAVRNRQQQRRKHERKMQQKLPQDRMVRHWFSAYFNEGFEQIDGRNANEGGGQLHFERARVEVG